MIDLFWVTFGSHLFAAAAGMLCGHLISRMDRGWKK